MELLIYINRHKVFNIISRFNLTDTSKYIKLLKRAQESNIIREM